MAISLGIAALAWPDKSALNCLTTPFADASIFEQGAANASP
jgi:hypothetical protein